MHLKSLSASKKIMGVKKIPSQTIRQSLYFMKALLQLAQPNPIDPYFELAPRNANAIFQRTDCPVVSYS